MDPLSQAVCGVLAAGPLSKPSDFRTAAIVGALSGMAADADIFIRSSQDPLLAIEYHRHFTHSLAFIPVGGLIVGLLLWGLFFRRQSLRLILLWSIVGYATHGLLDACTNYGTQLFWPFSNERLSWSMISIVDPLFTIPLLVALIIAFIRKSPRLSLVTLICGLAYLSLGLVQRERAESMLATISEQRQHQINRYEVKPSFGNLIVWKSIYETSIDGESRIFVDAIRVPPFGEKTFLAGGSVKKWEPNDVIVGDLHNTTLDRDIRRFAWFSDSFLAESPEGSGLIGDMRFSLLPHEMQPLWAIRVDVTRPNQHVDFINTRPPSDGKVAELLRMVVDGYSDFQR